MFINKTQILIFMVGFKVVIGTKQGKCTQKEIQEPESNVLLGKQIGNNVKGDEIGFPGYEFEITGGSDNCGFPMRQDVPGIGRKRILAIKGVIGLKGVYSKKYQGKVIKKKIGKGIRIRKTVCGNTIHPNIVQINLKVLKEGSQPLITEIKEEKKE